MSTPSPAEPLAPSRASPTAARPLRRLSPEDSRALAQAGIQDEAPSAAAALAGRLSCARASRNSGRGAVRAAPRRVYGRGQWKHERNGKTRNRCPCHRRGHVRLGGAERRPRAPRRQEMEVCVSGLFAAGEAVGGVNGANRLSGNALPEALVFGQRSGCFAAAAARKRPASPRARLPSPKRRSAARDAALGGHWTRLQEVEQGRRAANRSVPPPATRKGLADAQTSEQKTNIRSPRHRNPGRAGPWPERGRAVAGGGGRTTAAVIPWALLPVAVALPLVCHPR